MNPIIAPEHVTPSNPNMEVIGVFNAGVTRFKDEILLLLRVAERPINHDAQAFLTPIYRPSEGRIAIQRIPRDHKHDFSDVRVIRSTERNYLTSISHLRLARSKDGIRFVIDGTPTILPSNEYETYGIEDPRITRIGEMFYITYSSISDLGICTSLISTTDFVRYERKGNIFHPDNKDVAIFPARIGGLYYALHRPSTSHYGKPDMWIAESDDLLKWGNHRHLAGVRSGMWDNGRVGASTVPIETDQGWIEIYHGADENNKYCLGVLLLDKDEPWRVLARSCEPFMVPEAPYEVDGFFGNVVFPCGAVCENGNVRIYYGASDTCIGSVDTTVEFLLAHLT